MRLAFYLGGAIAVLSTARMLTCVDVVHGLLYLVVSLLAVAVVFFSLGAPFVALLEVVVYAGAIMVLFVFVVMMLNLGARARQAERQLLPRRGWIGPLVLAAILFALLAGALGAGAQGPPPVGAGPEAVGAALFGPYVLGVELASLLLLAALVGAYHLGVRTRPAPPGEEVPRVAHPRESRPPPGLGAVRAGAPGSARPP